VTDVFDPSGLTPDQLRELIAMAEDAEDDALVCLYRDALEEALAWQPLPHQIPPEGEWSVWVLLAGRGTGKSDAGAAEMNTHMMGPPCDRRLPGGHRGRIIGPTYTDVVAACVNGPSGIKAHNPDVELKNTKEGTVVLWPNGAYARIFGAYGPDDPERLRSGGNSCRDWQDEFGAFRKIEEVWDQAQFGLRLGENPRSVITTTPKNRPKIRELAAAGDRYAAEGDSLPRELRVAITRASTKDNPHLAKGVRDALYAAYEGTRLGAQELEGQILDDLGTFFERAWFGLLEEPPPWPQKVRSWDLAGTPPGPANEDPDWTAGALVAYEPRQIRQTADGSEVHVGGFCVEDVVRLRDSPANVEQTVIDTARRDGPFVRVIIEREPGQSGKSQLAHFQQVLAGVALVEEHSPTGPKQVRAQLVSSAAQQGRVSLVRGNWNVALLDELEEFTGTPLDRHDDQVDALSQAFAVLEGRGGLASITLPRMTAPTRDEMLAGHRAIPRVGPRF
jgi:predicted phage terminase large subunit-like protein